MTTDAVNRRERARPLSATERREAILVATRPLLLAHGRATTTKLIAEACGIAEGTIFGVFASKDELFGEVMEREFDPSRFLAEIESLDLTLPLRERLIAATTILQHRFVTIFAMMTAMAVPKPPAGPNAEQRRELTGRGLVRVVEPDAGQLRVAPDEVARLLRLLTFSGSHPHLASDHTLTPEEIVDVILHGTLVQHTTAAEGRC